MLVLGLLLQTLQGISLGLHVPFGLAHIGGLSCLYIIYIYVCVGTGGIVYSCLLPAGVGYLLAVGTPAELFRASKGEYRTFIGFALKQVLHLSQSVLLHRGQEDVWDGLHILVPVSVVHVVDHQSCGQGQVLLLRHDACGGRYLSDDHNLFAVG